MEGPVAASSLFCSGLRIALTDPIGCWVNAARLKSVVARLDRGNAASYGGRLLPLVLLWLQGDTRSQDIRMPLHWYGEGHVPITIHRSSWGDPNATFVGLKGGSPSANHGQMDTGSFVLDADGVRWAMDLGAEGYHGIESRGMNLWSSAQNSDRWTIFRQSNHGHNTLVINDQLQRASGTGTIIDFSENVDWPHSVLDMSAVYAGQASSVKRGVALLPSREVLIQDDLVGLKPGATVRWGMITPGRIDAEDAASITLRQDDATLTLKIRSPSDVTWREIDTATPRHEWDSPNRGTRMVAFDSVVPPSGELTIVVLATPGSCTDSVADDLQIRPLANWER